MSTSLKPASTSDIRQFIAQQAAAPAPSSPPRDAHLIPQEGIAVDLAENVKLPTSTKLPEPDIPLHHVVGNTNVDRTDTKHNILAGGIPMEDLTQAEKDIFIQSVLHRTQVVWPIELLEGRLVVTVQSLTSQSHEDVVYAWLDKLNADKVVTSTSMWATMLQRAHVFLRVRSIKRGTEVTETGAEAMVAGLTEAGADNVAKLDEYVRTCGATYAMHEFGLLASAVGIHERKLNTCVKAAASANFWQPAGTN